MKVLHISSECFPAAKTGGLGDVVGALPKYLCKAGFEAAAIIPKYSLKWINAQEYKAVFNCHVRLNNVFVPCQVVKTLNESLGYELYMVDIPGFFDRNGIYGDNASGHGYGDEVERYLIFQQAVLYWVKSMQSRPKILHCHDHHTGLIPFLTKHSPEFDELHYIGTIFTIHNGNYQGAFSWRNSHFLPYYYEHAYGYLDWNNTINPMATAIKCAWRVTTVSSTYLEEMRASSMGLESLLRAEWMKSRGILNGIDNEVWDPAKDAYLHKSFENNLDEYKDLNKKYLTTHLNLDHETPLITFIGRLAGEKGADLLPEIISKTLYSGMHANFIVLGSGNPYIAALLKDLQRIFPSRVRIIIDYNEGLAHQLYAGSDFLLMPSKVEPCGLNQMYAFRYGTVPIVRAVGGLTDTVWDVGDWEGRGFRFIQYNAEDAVMAIYRALKFYHTPGQMPLLRERIMNLDFSWETTCQKYIDLYKEIS